MKHQDSPTIDLNEVLNELAGERAGMVQQILDWASQMSRTDAGRVVANTYFVPTGEIGGWVTSQSAYEHVMGKTATPYTPDAQAALTALVRQGGELTPLQRDALHAVRELARLGAVRAGVTSESDVSQVSYYVCVWVGALALADHLLPQHVDVLVGPWRRIMAKSCTTDT